MARYECFSRSTTAGDRLLPIARQALEGQGFKILSELGDSMRLVDGRPARRLRDRVVVVLDERRQADGHELLCVVSNEAIPGSGDGRCRDSFNNLVALFRGLPGVEVEWSEAVA